MNGIEKYHGFKVGDKVICNGFPGTVTRLCDWSDRMVEVKLNRGEVAVSSSELKKA
jgi:hypothetical protein